MLKRCSAAVGGLPRSPTRQCGRRWAPQQHLDHHVERVQVAVVVMEHVVGVRVLDHGAGGLVLEAGSLLNQSRGLPSDGFAGGVALFCCTSFVAMDGPNTFGPRFHCSRSRSPETKGGRPLYKPRCKGFFCMGELYSRILACGKSGSGDAIQGMSCAQELLQRLMRFIEITLLVAFVARRYRVSNAARFSSR